MVLDDVQYFVAGPVLNGQWRIRSRREGRCFAIRVGVDWKDDVAAEPRAIPGETWVGEF